MDHIWAFCSFLMETVHWPTTFLLVALLVVRWCQAKEGSSLARAIIVTLVGWTAVRFAFVAGNDANVWGAPSALLGAVTFPLRILSSGLDHLLWGWAGDVGRATLAVVRWFLRFRSEPWPYGEVIALMPQMAFALLAATAVRPLASPAAHARMRDLLPARLRPLATNSWPETYSAWMANAAVLLLCLAPTLVIGIVAAIYLRLKRPDLLWSLTWVAAMVAFGMLIGQVLERALGASGLLNVVVKAIGMNSYLTIHSIAVAVMVTCLLATAMSAVPQSKAARRIYLALILVCLPSVVTGTWAALWRTIVKANPSILY